MASARTPSKNFVVEITDRDGSNYRALEAQLIDPWDEFYIPTDESVEGFDIVWDPVGATLLRVRIAEHARGAGPIDISTILADKNGRNYVALEQQLVEPFDVVNHIAETRVLGFDIAHHDGTTTLTVVVA